MIVFFEDSSTGEGKSFTEMPYPRPQSRNRAARGTRTRDGVSPAVSPRCA